MFLGTKELVDTVACQQGRKVRAEPLFGTLMGIKVEPKSFRAASRRREGLPNAMTLGLKKRSQGHIRGHDGQEVARSDDGR